MLCNTVQYRVVPEYGRGRKRDLGKVGRSIGKGKPECVEEEGRGDWEWEWEGEVEKSVERERGRTG